jgi:hypothetical protein
MKTIRTMAGLILAFLCCLATAADLPPQDGVWLKDGIDAYNRFMGQGGAQSDIMKGMGTAGWLGGVITAQRDRTSEFLLSMGVFAGTYRDLKQKNDKDAEIARNLYKNAQFYVPKFNVPVNVQIEQIMAVVLKYLTNHPEKWQYSAISLTKAALTDAFPEQLLTQELK